MNNLGVRLLMGASVSGDVTVKTDTIRPWTRTLPTPRGQCGLEGSRSRWVVSHPKRFARQRHS